MKNWSTDEQKMAKNKAAHSLWRLESLINFGLDGAKLKKSELKKSWKKLHIDPAKRKFLDLLLHGN